MELEGILALVFLGVLLIIFSYHVIKKIIIPIFISVIKITIPKWKSKDIKIKEQAVKNLKPVYANQKIFVKIAKSDELWYIRNIAVQKLIDQALLSSIAKNDVNNSVRRSAIEKLNNQNLLLEIAKNDKDMDCRFAATMKLDNLSLQVENLIDIFKSVKKETLMLEIANILREIYLNEKMETSLKKEILSLKGHKIRNHKDSSRYYDLSPDCNLASRQIHEDDHAIFFKL